MDAHRFFVEKLRFHLTEPDKLVFVGWFFDGSTAEHTLSVFLDGGQLPLLIQVNKGAEVRQKYLRSINEITEEAVGIVTLPADWKQGRRLRVESSFRGHKSRAYTVSVRKLCKMESQLEYYIENCHRGDGKVTVTGWCMGAGEVKLELLDSGKQPVSGRSERYFRRDLLSVFPECGREGKPGFLIEAPGEASENGVFYLRMREAERISVVKLTKWDSGTPLQYAAGKAGDALRYLARNGFAATVYKVKSKLSGHEPNSYANWLKKYDVTEEELARERQETFAFMPKFSVVVPVYRTNPVFLREMIASIVSQTYTNWELCLAWAQAKEADSDAALAEILKEYAGQDARVRYTVLAENLGISGNTNAAVGMASGDYLVLADHDDIVPANALYEFAAAVNRDRAVDVLYSDEDKISMDGKCRFEPHFKPDYNPDLLCSVNYICHLFAVRRDVAEAAGAFDGAYDGAQDLDFILRCCERAQKIYHVPKILYHWRCHMESTASNPESKRYAFEAGRAAVEAHYRRLSVPARVEHGTFPGMYRTIYLWEEEPLVSVVIPNKDHSEDLAKCMDSILGKSTYRNLEFVIVENNSTEPETFAYYDKLQKAHENVRVVTYKGSFNYSKINNFGAAHAKGAYLLLLNNDTEMTDGSCIGELLGFCMRDDVGIVGAKLLYADETIQHAGVVLGFGGTAGHAFIGKGRYDTGYAGRILCAQDCSAVTAACMMVKRSVYEQVGGLTEELAVAFNDIDFCLKVREAGKLVVYNPYAELFHYESKSRGLEDSPEKVERFNSEVEILLSRWRGRIEQGDPYYNPNLTLDNSDFSLRK